MSKPRVIAFYLPQYYPTKENDKWWGAGFTEWTNVGRAKPLFFNHYQPKIPADFGYYDLRVPETREKQAKLAKSCGIEGFMYWHYWFDGKKILDDVFEDVVKSGKPDFPFSLCWANHSWYKKTWDPKAPNKLLIEQTYPGKEDYINHFNYLLSAFKDPRYIKVDNKLLFGIFDPIDLSQPQLFFDVWNQLAKENGLDGFYFVALSRNSEKSSSMLSKGYDAVLIDYLIEFREKALVYTNFFMKIIRHLIHYVPRHDYNQYVKMFKKDYKPLEGILPCIYPNFDHSPRSGAGGLILHDATPKKWGKLCRWIFTKCKFRDKEHNLVFIKAWNEWGEGNYLEPDLKYGHGYIDELKNELDQF